MNGSLDDLSIEDVLQILSLGRKTGSLLLETPTGAGAIVFREGRVVASNEDGGAPLREGLPSLPGAERETLIRERITAFVCRLARCRRGEFRFEASTPRVIEGWVATGAALRSGMDVIELLIATTSRQDDGEPEETHADGGSDRPALEVSPTLS